MAAKETQVSEIEKRASAPDFWDDPETAQAEMRRLSSLREEVERWQTLSQRVQDTLDLYELDDESLALMIGKRKMPFSKLKSILKGAPRVILVGDPGVGKSSAVAKLEIDMLKHASASVMSGAPGRATSPT